MKIRKCKIKTFLSNAQWMTDKELQNKDPPATYKTGKVLFFVQANWNGVVTRGATTPPEGNKGQRQQLE